jgi:hypothetical protein
MTMFISSRNEVPSVTKMSNWSQQNMCDAPSVTKSFSSPNCHKLSSMTILASSVTNGEGHRWELPY